MPDRALRVVFDTNVLLSLFVFADSKFLPLRDEVANGRWLAMTNNACFAEFQRVLGYPMFSLDAERQQSTAASYHTLATFISIAEGVTGSPLPKCRDKDDQKFLELARDGQADWLITADKLLLKLRRGRRLDGLFRILTPDEALATLNS